MRTRVAVVLGLLAVVGLTSSGCTQPLPEKGTAVLTVTDSSGATQADCSLTRVGVGDSPWPLTEEAGSTGPDGTFAWPMYPGGFIVSALCPDGRRGSTEVEITSGAESRARIVVA